MIEFQQLKQLITISDSGTISKAAELLFLSQPALSRSMQKLEEELGVEIFSRQKNKVELNENGKLAVGYAKKLLEDFDIYIENVRSFNKSLHTISVGVCAPAPLWQLVPKLYSAFPDKTITTEIKETATLKKGLIDETYNIIITNEQIDIPECISREFCRENLYLCVSLENKLSNRQDGINFADMNGITMLLYEQIGSWSKVRDYLPNTHFIVQTDRNNFTDLITESTLPFFATNLTLKHFGFHENRIAIPIKEDNAVEVFYINVLKKSKDLLLPL